MANWTGTDHTRKISEALDSFERALTRRWRHIVAEAIYEDRWDFPRAVRRSTAADQYAPLWSFSSQEARVHIIGRPGCSTLQWVWLGQPGADESGPPGCQGWVGSVGEGTPADLPDYIECGVASILTRVADWAWAERTLIFERLPLFDGLDLDALQVAHDAFLAVGAELGLDADTGSAAGVLEPFTRQDVADRRIPKHVASISSEYGPGAERQNWWVGWTGLEADWAKAGFFASVAETARNQAGIAGSLANLYAFRAAIIEKGRNDALFWVESATRALGATRTEVTDYTTGWKVVQGIGGGTLVVAGWIPVGTVVGSAVTLAGFLGENLISEGTPKEVDAHGIAEVVEALHHEITLLTSGSIHGLEGEYQTAVYTLDSLIYNTHSYNLELYDLTQNNPTGDPAIDATGSYANVDAILSIAKGCYENAEWYEELLPSLARTTGADAHLADQDGTQTRADLRLLELRDLLERFLKTTIGRYLLAGEQTEDAARRYAEEDDRARQDFADIEGSFEGGYDVGFDPERYAEETFRPGRAGERDDSVDYQVEGSDG